MPQASDALREEFGIDDGPVMDFLEAKGARLLLPTYIYLIPDDVGLTAKMFRAIQFLHQEWDFAGMWLFEFELREGVANGTLDGVGRVIKKKEESDHDC